MPVNIEGLRLPAGASVDIKLEIKAQINITAFVAQQQVTGFVISEISNQLCGESPDLRVGDRICWSVPVVLTSPFRGALGRVGDMLVDANTGELLVDPDLIERIRVNAESLAERSPL